MSPPSHPPLLAPGPADSASVAPTPTTLPSLAMPAQSADTAIDPADEVRHVPLDSVFQPRTPLEQTYHEVIAGESLSAIAKQYGVTAGAIQQANGLDAKAALTPGQMLFIPNPKSR